MGCRNRKKRSIELFVVNKLNCNIKKDFREWEPVPMNVSSALMEIFK